MQAILWNVRHCRFHCQLLGHKGAVFAADLNQEATVALTASGDKVGCCCHGYYHYSNLNNVYRALAYGVCRVDSD